MSIAGLAEAPGGNARRPWLGLAWPDAAPGGSRGGFVVDAGLIVLAWALVSVRFISGLSAIPWDSVDEFFPQTRFVVDSIRAGHAPWWNPYIYGGQPVLGDPQGMIFTPQVLVGLIAGPYFNHYIFDMTALVTVLCGGIALARYARPYADNRTLPILGALVFMAGGVATSRLQHVPQIVSYGLLPVQLLALRATCLRPTVFRTVLLVLVLLAGALNPNQVTYLSAFAFLPFLALHLHQSDRRIAAICALAVAATAVLLAVSPMLSAILEFVSISNRPVTDIGESVGASLHLYEIASIFLPGLFGIMTPLNGIWSPTDMTQDYLYIGVIPAAVLLSSLLFPRRRRAVVLLCWASIVAWYVFAMGMNTPLYPFLFHHLPGQSGFRRPADGVYLVNFFLALLVGVSCVPSRARLASWPMLVALLTLLTIIGAELLARLALYAASRGHGSDLLIVLRAFSWRAVLVLAIVLAARWTDRRAVRWLAAPVLVGLTVLDLASAGRARSVFAPPVSGSDVLQAYSGNLTWTRPHNALEATIDYLRQHGVTGVDPAWRMEALGGSLGGNMPAAFEILTTQGYDPLRLHSYDQAIGGQYLQNETKRFTPVAPGYDSPDYRRLGLRYVLIQSYIASHTANFGDFGAAIAKIRNEFIATGSGRLLDTNGVYEIWELRDPMPRATVIAADGTQQPCRIVDYGTVSLSVVCRAGADGGRLVLGDNDAPGWKACVNGQPVPVAPYQDIFRSVAVPPGDSRIDFRYQAVPFLRGGMLCSG
jgi:hypothetical protein